MNNPKKNIPKKPASLADRVVKPQAKPTPQQKDLPGRRTGMKLPVSNRSMEIVLLCAVSVITFIVFHYTLQNEFLTNWDDWIYVTKDPYITSFTAPHLFSILFQDITLNYYHPLTMLSYAVNYQFSGLNPWGYYFTAILIHIANGVMIFYFAKALMKSMEGAGYKPVPAVPWLLGFLALWQGIHPMHVESVSWISERKDVLYFFFYYFGLLFYLRYLKGEKTPWMAYLNIVFALLCLWGIFGLWGFSIEYNKKPVLPVAIIFALLFFLFGGAAAAELKFKKYRPGLFYVWEFFLLSLFSKPMAVSFPLSLLAIDVLLKRDIAFSPHVKSWLKNLFVTGFKLVKEKWMFFGTALLSGILSIVMQVGHDTVAFTNGYSVPQKFLISSYAFTMYTFKAFVPINLCSYYPFPSITYDHWLPTIYYWMPLFAIAIITVPLYLSYKKSKDNFRIVLFCLLYFFGTIVFILQFLSDGKTIISDRYSYVSYFGIFFLVIYFAHRYWQKSKALHIPILILLGGVSVILAYISYGRTRIWHNAGTMWKDVIVKTGYDFPIPYMSLGDWYKEKQEYDSAFPYYQALAALHSKSPEVYQDLGKIYGMHHQFDSCLVNITRSLRLDSTNYGAYFDRAITYCMMSNFDYALKDFNKAFTLDSTDPGLWTQRGAALFQTGQFALASKDYSRLIRKQPESPDNWYQRGNCELNLGIIPAAIKDYQQALTIKTNYPDCLYNLSVAYDKIADYKNALDYAIKAKQAGAKVPDEYLNRVQKAAK